MGEVRIRFSMCAIILTRRRSYRDGHRAGHSLPSTWRREGAEADIRFSIQSWYASFNRLSMVPGENALMHYVTRGWKEGCDPHPSFSISLYLEANPEIRYRGRPARSLPSAQPQ